MKIIRGWAFPDDDEFMASEMRADGTYQLSHLVGAVKHCKARAVAVDGGAHIGTWSKVLVTMFDRVIAFEPSLDTYECLLHNIGDLPNVEFHHAALGRKPGKVHMTLEGFERAIAMKNTGARFTAEGGDVDRITLDSLNLPALDFFKLDVEGGEVDAIFGAEQTLRRHRPIVLFEDKGLWKRYGYARRKPQQILGAMGARHIERLGMDEVWGW